jgi:hypothetical protein
MSTISGYGSGMNRILSFQNRGSGVGYINFQNVQEIMGFNDYRPLMLCKVLRKIWSNSVIRRIMDAWTQHGILDDIDHAYMWGRGTATATITLQNYIEDIEEKTQASHQSSNFSMRSCNHHPNI